MECGEGLKQQKEKEKTYNSVNMAVVTQSIAVLILAASRLMVKRSVRPRTPWKTASTPVLVRMRM